MPMPAFIFELRVARRTVDPESRGAYVSGSARFRKGEDVLWL
jgi:hypothetical protein